ncbi:hypothetical protein B0H13DRAFT_1882964 [Mycena leptocephala]|nr:hypothetical protein B0H13DRAFT_1882964 [Mycena leptocephala]
MQRLGKTETFHFIFNYIRILLGYDRKRKNERTSYVWSNLRERKQCRFYFVGHFTEEHPIHLSAKATPNSTRNQEIEPLGIEIAGKRDADGVQIRASGVQNEFNGGVMGGTVASHEIARKCIFRVVLGGPADDPGAKLAIPLNGLFNSVRKQIVKSAEHPGIIDAVAALKPTDCPVDTVAAAIERRVKPVAVACRREAAMGWTGPISSSYPRKLGRSLPP